MLTALLFGCVFLMAGCSLPWQHSSPGSSLGPHPTAQQVLDAVQKNFRSVTSFHVMMKTDNLGPANNGQIQIRDADGDVLMPDRISAKADVLISGQALTVNLITIGSQEYITDPVTGQWRVIKGGLDPRTLTNPDTGLISLAGKLHNVTGPVAEDVNGTACWRVDGVLDAKDLAAFTGGGAPEGSTLQTTVWAGQSDGLPYEIKIVGQAADGDTPQTTRTFFISKYNENLKIVAPQM
jgi:hypothetical protein